MTRDFNADDADQKNSVLIPALIRGVSSASSAFPFSPLPRVHRPPAVYGQANTGNEIVLHQREHRLGDVLRTALAFHQRGVDRLLPCARAVVVLGFGPYMAARQRIAELALRHRLPTFFSWRDHVEAGGLMSYGPDLSDLLRRAASYVDESSKAPRPPIYPWSSRRSWGWASM